MTANTTQDTKSYCPNCGDLLSVADRCDECGWDVRPVSDAVIERAAKVICDAGAGIRWSANNRLVRETARRRARALAEAGLLVKSED